jgi:hypothetical protein
MRFAPLAVMLALAWAATVHAEGQTTVGVPADPKIDAAVHAALDKRLPELRFDNVGFSDVVDFLRDVTGTNIFVNWKKIEAAGIDRNTPVSARLGDVPFRKALRVVLDNLSDRVKLDFTVDEGVISISTAEDLQSNIVTMTYDVRGLADWRKNAAPATRPSDAKDPLIGMITGSIAPATWGKDGPGQINEHDGQLIVTATQENHKLIANLLDNLKRLAK